MSEITLRVQPDVALRPGALKREIARALNLSTEQIASFSIVRRSIDARGGRIWVNLCVRVFLGDERPADEVFEILYRDVRHSPAVIVVGAGPAGLFAALRLIELGLKPVIVERGKPVAQRKRDVAALNRNLKLNVDSNYAFGEGGAGTFSDGKLFTRSKKRGDNRKILQIFCQHGADAAILYEAHPHIGSDRLPGIVQSIGSLIVEHGGEIYFNSCVQSIVVEGDRAVGVQLLDGAHLLAQAVILATGHSANDVYDMLLQQNIELQAKPFAVGVRVEHPQELIDSIQYHGIKHGEELPAASYSLVTQVDGLGVYSFCMCPGGFIVPSATALNQVVVNGMSTSRRHSPFANSGVLVEVRLDDLAAFAEFGPLAGLEFQRRLEVEAHSNGGFGVIAPAQRLADFVAAKSSGSLPRCSYNPGIVASDLHRWLPAGIGARLQRGFVDFDRKMHGFLTNQAVLLGVESRSSSPVRIPRHADTLQHVRVRGLFPAGEGAGYAGGIVSSALDGDRCAEAVANYLKQK